MPEDPSLVELYECPVCRKKVEKLYPVTREDMQREHTLGWKVCASCLQKVRDSGHHIVRYGSMTAVRDLVVLTCLLFPALVALSYAVTTIIGSSLVGDFRLSFYPPLIAFLMGLSGSFGGIRYRYAVSHGLRWSVQTRSVIIAFALMLAGLLSLTAVMQLRI